MHATDVVAYTFNAEILCPECTGHEVLDYYFQPGTVEDELDREAGRRGIDRADERSFDSDDFPKVVFLSDLNGDEACNHCGEELA